MDSIKSISELGGVITLWNRITLCIIFLIILLMILLIYKKYIKSLIVIVLIIILIYFFNIYSFYSCNTLYENELYNTCMPTRYSFKDNTHRPNTEGYIIKEYNNLSDDVKNKNKNLKLNKYFEQLYFRILIK